MYELLEVVYSFIEDHMANLLWHSEGSLSFLRMSVNSNALFNSGPRSIGCQRMFFWLLGVTVGMTSYCIFQYLLSLKRCATVIWKSGLFWLSIVFFDVGAARGGVLANRSYDQPTFRHSEEWLSFSQTRVSYNALFNSGPCSIGSQRMLFWSLGVTVGMILYCIFQCLLSLKRCAAGIWKSGWLWLCIVCFRCLSC